LGQLRPSERVPGASRRRFLAAWAATLTPFTIVRAPAGAAQYQFKYGSGLTAEHPQSVRCRQMWAAIERESGGRIHTEMFLNNQLGSDAAMLSQLRLGAIQFLGVGGPLQPVVPAVDILSVCFAFRSEDEALHTADGPLGDYLRKEILAKDIYPLRKMWASGMRQMTSSTHPIRTADDLNGFKIRVVNSRISIDFYKTLGASPQPLPNNEMYTALQTKLVDGNDISLVTTEQQRLYEVQKYLSLTYHAWANLWLLASADVWRSLPADLQEIIERNNTKHVLLERRDANALNASLANKLERRGLTVNRPDQASFQRRLPSYYASCATTFGSTAWGLLQGSVSAKLS
jgi:TRAP-type transport system periplasmic protein